jgi:hypothetical protein
MKINMHEDDVGTIVKGVIAMMKQVFVGVKWVEARVYIVSNPLEIPNR